jgi:CheY-like chemotaxis protein
MSDDKSAPLAAARGGASELNNLLQIISGTTALMENIWVGRDEAGKYLAMLRETVDRAAELTVQLVEQAGGATGSVIASAESKPIVPLQLRSMDVKPRVLIVDDEPAMLTLMHELLLAEGYEAVKAESGCKALDILARDRDACDLVLLDYAMPFMSGEETFRRLRVIAPDLPVILATGFIAKDVLDRMFAGGLAGFIRKPLPPDELLQSIATLLSARWSSETFQRSRHRDC